MRDTKPRPASPHPQRTTTGCSRTTLRGTWRTDSDAEVTARELRELVVRGQALATHEGLSEQLRPLSQDVGKGVKYNAGLTRLVGQGAGNDSTFGDLDERGGAFRHDLTDMRRVPALEVGLDVLPFRGPQVDVQREEVVRLDGQLVVGSQSGESVGQQPVGLALRRGDSANDLFAREGQVQ